LIARGREFTYGQQTNCVNGKLINICVAHDCDFSRYLIDLVKVVVVEERFPVEMVGEREVPKFGGLLAENDIDRLEFFRRQVPEATATLSLCRL
jgi:hypothetical protein